MSTITFFILAVTAGFIAGSFFTHTYENTASENDLENIAPRISLPHIRRAFNYSSPFSREPPQRERAGEISEPIWDSLLPSEFLGAWLSWVSF